MKKTVPSYWRLPLQSQERLHTYPLRGRDGAFYLISRRENDGRLWRLHPEQPSAPNEPLTAVRGKPVYRGTLAGQYLWLPLRHPADEVVVFDLSRDTAPLCHQVPLATVLRVETYTRLYRLANREAVIVGREPHGRRTIAAVLPPVGIHRPIETFPLQGEYIIPPVPPGQPEQIPWALLLRERHGINLCGFDPYEGTCRPWFNLPFSTMDGWQHALVWDTYRGKWWWALPGERLFSVKPLPSGDAHVLGGEIYSRGLPRGWRLREVVPLPHVVVAVWEYERQTILHGYDPDTGEERWRHPLAELSGKPSRIVGWQDWVLIGQRTGHIHALWVHPMAYPRPVETVWKIAARSEDGQVAFVLPFGRWVDETVFFVVWERGGIGRIPLVPVSAGWPVVLAWAQHHSEASRHEAALRVRWQRLSARAYRSQGKWAEAVQTLEETGDLVRAAAWAQEGAQRGKVSWRQVADLWVRAGREASNDRIRSKAWEEAVLIYERLGHPERAQYLREQIALLRQEALVAITLRNNPRIQIHQPVRLDLEVRNQGYATAWDLICRVSGDLQASPKPQQLSVLAPREVWRPVFQVLPSQIGEIVIRIEVEGRRSERAAVEVLAVIEYRLYAESAPKQEIHVGGDYVHIGGDGVVIQRGRGAVSEDEGKAADDLRESKVHIQDAGVVIGRDKIRSETMVCPKCGAPLPGKVRFCPACGEKLLGGNENVV